MRARETNRARSSGTFSCRSFRKSVHVFRVSLEISTTNKFLKQRRTKNEFAAQNRNKEGKK